MSKNTYWLVDEAGNKTIVVGAEERDRWIPHGYTVSDAPLVGEQVWCQHTEHKGKALFPAETLVVWSKLGWEVSSPPEVPDVTKDPALRDQPVEAPTAPAADLTGVSLPSTTKTTDAAAAAKDTTPTK